MKTPIEKIAEALMRQGFLVGTILIPEQCLECFAGEKQFHVTIEEVPA